MNRTVRNIAAFLIGFFGYLLIFGAFFGSN